MKALRFRKLFVAAGFVFAGLAFLPDLRADVEVFIVGGNASSSVLFDRATNLLNGGFTVTGGSSSQVRSYVGTSTLPTLSGLGNIQLDINLLGAVGGLEDLLNQTTETNALGVFLVPTVVDSSTSPEAVGINSVTANFAALPTYVVPYVFIKNNNSADTAAITNLTQRQAQYLETATLPARFFGGTSTNAIYFVGRNSQAAVRTEVDLNVYNSQTINTYFTNALGQPVLDTSADPGLVTGSAVTATVLVLTNSIGTVAVQNLKSGVSALSYEGVPYSAANVENGSYPLWGYENYYYITSPNTGHPSTAQLSVINALYASATNATFQVSTVFTNNFIPNSSLRVTRAFDGGAITVLPNY
jgi:hypothetical protein